MGMEFDTPAETLQAAAAAEELAQWREHLQQWLANYPEDVFPPESQTPDAIGARMGRHVLSTLIRDVEARRRVLLGENQGAAR